MDTMQRRETSHTPTNNKNSLNNDGNKTLLPLHYNNNNSNRTNYHNIRRMLGNSTAVDGGVGSNITQSERQRILLGRQTSANQQYLSNYTPSMQSLSLRQQNMHIQNMLHGTNNRVIRNRNILR